MATTTKRKSAATRRKSTRATSAKGPRPAALKRLNQSLEAAQKAVKAVRGDVTTGGRDLARDLERMISQARKDVTKLEKAVRKDLAELQKSITKRETASRARKRPAAKRRSAKRPAAKSRSSARR